MRKLLLVTGLVAGCAAGGSPSPASIDAVTPASGAAISTRITITGSALAPDRIVPRAFLDEVELTAVDADDENRVEATVPAGLTPGPHDLRVLTGAGLVARLAHGFTVIGDGADPPRVWFAEPLDGTKVGVGATVSVRVEAQGGAGDVSVVGLDVSGAASVTERTSEEPPAPDSAGIYSFEVPGDARSGDAITLAAFALDDSAPQQRGEATPITLWVALDVTPGVAAISPARGRSGGGTVVEIDGSSFSATTTVTLGGAALIDPILISPTQIRGTTAQHAAGAVDVVVSDTYGSASLTGGFVYQQPATVSLDAPASLIADGASMGAIVARVVDGDGLPVSGEPVALAATAGTIGPITDRGDGSYRATLTAPIHVGDGALVVTASDRAASIKPTVSATVLLLSGAPANIRLRSLAPDPLVADGVSQAVGIAEVDDGFGNPIAGTSLSIDVGGAGVASAPEDLGGGSYRFTITAPSRIPPSGRIDLMLDAGAAIAGATLQLIAGAPALLSIEEAPGGFGISVGAVELTAGTGLPLYAVTRDANGNFSGAASATWSVSTANGAVSAGPATSTIFEPMLTGTCRVLASAPGLADATTGIITIAPGPVASFVIAPPSYVEVQTPAAFAFTAVDAFGNLVPGYQGSVAVTDDLQSSSPGQSATFIAGALTQGVAFARPSTSDHLTLNDGAGHLGVSPPFNVVFGVTISGCSPAHGFSRGGDAVTLVGSGFRAGVSATIGGRALLSATVVDAQTITGITPPGTPGAADVSVSRLGFPVKLAAGFTYLATGAQRVPALRDTTLRSTAGATTWNFGREATLGVGSLDGEQPLGASTDRALLAFDVASAVPSGAQVMDAQLILNPSAQGWARIVPVTVSNLAAAALPAGMPIAVHLDHAALVVAGKSAADGDDLHLLYLQSDGTYLEVERMADAVATWDLPTTTLWLKSQVAIAAGASDTNYAIGYGAVAAPPHLPQPNAVFDPPATAQTQALFHFEDRAGTRAADSSGNTRDATLTAFSLGGWGPGFLSCGLALDGKGYATAKVPQPTGAFTTELWFKTSKAAGGLLSWMTAPPSSGQHPMELYLANGHVVARIVDPNAQILTATTVASFNDGAWHHLAITYDLTNLGVFLDGQLLGTAALAGVQAAATTMVIGGSVSQGLLVGAIDGVSVSSVARQAFPYATLELAAAEGAEALVSTPKTLAAWRVLQPFTEGVGAPAAGVMAPGPASWLLYAGGAAWSAPGAAAASDTAGDGGAYDRAASPLGVATAVAPGNPVVIDVTAAAQHWANGSWQQLGVVVAQLEERADFTHQSFASLEASDPTTRPVVRVTYYDGSLTPLTVTVHSSSATLESAAPTTNFAGGDLTVARAINGGDSHALLLFPVSASVPAGKTIVGAQLMLQRKKSLAVPTASIAIRALLRAWDPVAVTWNSTGTVAWSLAGARGAGTDRIETPAAFAWLPPATGTAAIGADLLPLAQVWLDQPQQNDGVELDIGPLSQPAGTQLAPVGDANEPVLQISYLP